MEINVIDTDGKINLASISNYERVVIFDQMAQNNPDIPKYHFDSFLDSWTTSMQRAALKTRPVLRELLLRKIIQINRTHEIYNNIIPITPGNAFRSMAARGGRAPHRPMPARAIALNPNATIIKFDTTILTCDENGRDYIAGPGEQIQSLGIIVNTGDVVKILAPGSSPAKPVFINARMVQYAGRAPNVIIGNYTAGSVARAGIIETIVRAPVFIVMNGVDDVKQYNHIFDSIMAYDDYNNSIACAAYIHAVIDNAIQGKGGILLQLSQVPITKPFKSEFAPITNELLKLVERVWTGRFYDRGFSVLADLQGIGMFDLGHLNLADDREQIDEIIAVYKTQQLRATTSAQLVRQAARNYIKYSIYLSIIRARFPKSPAIQGTNIIEVERGCTAEQKRVVEAEYDRRIKYMQQLSTNKCAHLRAVARVMSTIGTPDIKRALADLQQFMVRAGSATVFKTCNLCGFDLICPHVLIIAQSRPYDEMKIALTPYIDTHGGYYCKVCNGFISVIDQYDDEIRDTKFTVSKELNDYIWHEVHIIIRFLSFRGLVSPNTFASHITEAIYQYIADIERAIIKSKTNTIDEMNAKKNLQTCLYIFAYLINIMKTNNSIVSFKDMKSRSAHDIKSDHFLVDALRHAYEIIIGIKNTTIKSIPGMTNDIVKTNLISAYKVISSANIARVDFTTELENSSIVIVMDPLYHYLYKTIALERVLPELGAAIKIILKPSHGSVYEHAIQPSLSGIDNFNKLCDGNIRIISGKEYDNAIIGYAAASFKLTFDKLRAGITSGIYIDRSARGDYSNITFSDEYLPAQQEYERLLRGQRIIEIARTIQRYKPIYLIPGGAQQWHAAPFVLGRVYDTNGSLHSWTYIDADGNTIDSKKIAKDLSNGEHVSVKAVDKKCTVCGIVLSKSASLSNTTIIHALDAKYSLNNFFRFFENRCPRGELHDMHDDVCVACGYSTALTNDTSQSIEYYTKYVSIYDKQRANLTADARQGVVERAFVSTMIEIPKWTFDFNIVHELSLRLKIKHQLLSTIGAVEQHEYKKIVSGEYIPSEAETRDDTRIHLLVGHCRNLIVEWNMVRFWSRLMKQPPDLAAIVGESGIRRENLVEVLATLPDISNDFNGKYAFVLQTYKPRECVNYLIETLCSMCLAIYDGTNATATTTKLREKFVANYIKKIIRGEELLAKAGDFNWNALYGNTTAESDNIDNDDNDVEVVQENDDETQEPLSFDGFDIEEDPDDETQSDEQTMIRVSDESGM